MSGPFALGLVTAQICFHFHQAAEKYLKSYIIASDLDFKKIHDLPAFLKSCLIKEPNLRILHPVHWPTKYSKKEALKVRVPTEHIRDAIKNSLKSLFPLFP